MNFSIPTLRTIAVLCLMTAATPMIAAAASPAWSQEKEAAPSRAADTISPQQAQRALETLQDDVKRNEMIDTLRSIATAAPAPATQETKPAIPLAADSLGAQILLKVSERVGDIAGEVKSAAKSVTRFPALWYWLQSTARDPATHGLLGAISWQLALVFGGGLAAEWSAAWLLRRPQAWLDARIPYVARAPAAVVDRLDPATTTAESADVPDLHRRHRSLTRIWQMMVRLPFAIGRLVLELLPLVAFCVAVASLLGAFVEGAGTTRLAIVAIVNAYLVARMIVCIMPALFNPLGLVRVREETAAYAEIWTRRIVGVGATGVAAANVAMLFGLYSFAHIAVIRLVMFAVHLMVVVVILQCRTQGAAMLRAPDVATGVLSILRNRLASLWHVLAIGVVVALWGVWALEIQDGYALLLRYLVGSVAVLLAVRLVSLLALGLIDRGFHIKPDILQRFPGLEARANRYLPLLRRIVSGAIAAVGLVALLQVWGVNSFVWFYGGQIGSHAVSATATIGIAALIGVAIWEGSNALMDRKLSVLTREAHFASAARLRTFRPIVRTTLLFATVAVVALTVLSEVGFNVAPLLAGAGIFGVAIGFGSQKLVQDVITGLFLLMENTVQVGDNVTVSGLTGVVENVSIRTIRLRAGDGSVHIVPFSAVTTITNASRGAGNASVSVNVAYDEDTDRAGQVLKDIAAGMRKEDAFRALIRSDLELWGVDKVDGAMATLVGQIRCTDSGRWPVQREFLRRMKLRFQEEDIEIAAPGTSVVVQMPATGLDAGPDQVEEQPRRRAALPTA